ARRALYSFPTRRSSDLEALSRPLDAGEDAAFEGVGGGLVAAEGDGEADVGVGDAVDAWGLRVGGAEEEREDQGDCEGGSFHRVRSEEHTSELQSRENLV